MTRRIRPALHALLVALIALGAMGGLHTSAPAAFSTAPDADRTRLDAWSPAPAATFLAAAGPQLPAPADAADRTAGRATARLSHSTPRSDAHTAERSRLSIRLAAAAHAGCARMLALARVGPLQTRSTSPPRSIS